MNLFERMQNIQNKDYEKELQIAIQEVRTELDNLTTERMCKVYSSYLLRKLLEKHILAHLINTLELGLSYEHEFVLISDITSKEYYLADLTFSQFERKDPALFQKLLQDGYQKVNDLEFESYLKNIENNDEIFLLEDVFHRTYKSKSTEERSR